MKQIKYTYTVLWMMVVLSSYSATFATNHFTPAQPKKRWSIKRIWISNLFKKELKKMEPAAKISIGMLNKTASSILVWIEDLGKKYGVEYISPDFVSKVGTEYSKLILEKSPEYKDLIRAADWFIDSWSDTQKSIINLKQSDKEESKKLKLFEKKFEFTKNTLKIAERLANLRNKLLEISPLYTELTEKIRRLVTLENQIAKLIEIKKEEFGYLKREKNVKISDTIIKLATKMKKHEDFTPRNQFYRLLEREKDLKAGFKHAEEKTGKKQKKYISAKLEKAFLLASFFAAAMKILGQARKTVLDQKFLEHMEIEVDIPGMLSLLYKIKQGTYPNLMMTRFKTYKDNLETIKIFAPKQIKTSVVNAVKEGYELVLTQTKRYAEALISDLEKMSRKNEIDQIFLKIKKIINGLAKLFGSDHKDVLNLSTKFNEATKKSNKDNGQPLR